MRTNSPMNCPMCGHVTFNLIAKAYRYDSGEEFKEYVCPPCGELHEKISGGK